MNKTRALKFMHHVDTLIAKAQEAVDGDLPVSNPEACKEIAKPLVIYIIQLARYRQEFTKKNPSCDGRIKNQIATGEKLILDLLPGHREDILARNDRMRKAILETSR